MNRIAIADGWELASCSDRMRLYRNVGPDNGSYCLAAYYEGAHEFPSQEEAERFVRGAIAAPHAAKALALLREQFPTSWELAADGARTIGRLRQACAALQKFERIYSPPEPKPPEPEAARAKKANGDE